MNVVDATVHWLFTAGHWTGTAGVLHRLLEHVEISALAVGIATLVAVPVGMYCGHTRRLGIVAGNIAEIGLAVPTFAVLVVFAATPIGFGDRAAVIAMAIFAVPPILTNTYVGVRDVDPDVTEAARGMGMTGGQVLRRVELPLALPLLAAGLRTATIQVIATATLAAYVGGGGLGTFIYLGDRQNDFPQMLSGAVLVALVAVAAELVLGRLQAALTPGRRSRRGPRGGSPLAAAPVPVGALD